LKPLKNSLHFYKESSLQWQKSTKKIETLK